MNEDGVRVQKLLGKEVIALKDGSFIGKIQSIVVNSNEKKVIGIYVKLKGLLSGRNFVPFSGIQAFGTHTVTTKENLESEAVEKGVEEKEIINMPVITIGGTMLGKVDDFTFDMKSGLIKEYILSGGLVQDTLRGKALLKGEDVSRIGKDVIVVLNEIDETALEELDEYEDIKEGVVDTFNEAKENVQEIFEESKKKVEEGINASKEAAESAWQQSLNKAKNVSEEWTNKIKEQADKVGDEAKGLWSDAQSTAHKQLEKLNQVKEKWQDKITNIRGKKQDELGENILKEIKGRTISKSLVDNAGEIIIEPGQVIDDDIIKKALEKGKIHDLFILAAAKDVEDEIEKVDN